MSANRIDANRPVAERVIDGDTHTVILDLAPIAAGLINDIALAMRGRGHLFTVLANNRVGSPEHTAVRDEILRILQRSTALQPVLGPDQADELASDLFEASAEPPWCGCGEAYATRVDGDCEACGNRSDVAGASIAQLRAV